MNDQLNNSPSLAGQLAELENVQSKITTLIEHNRAAMAGYELIAQHAGIWIAHFSQPHSTLDNDMFYALGKAVTDICTRNAFDLGLGTDGALAQLKEVERAIAAVKGQGSLISAPGAPLIQPVSGSLPPSNPNNPNNPTQARFRRRS